MEIKPMGIARNKIWIIYILNELKFRVKEDQLAQICDEFKLMDCFDFSRAMNELIDNEIIKKEESPLGWLFSMSPLGESTLEFFGKELSYTKRKEVSAYLKKNNDDIFLKSVIGYDCMSIGGGRYRIMLRLIEQDFEVFDLTLIANDNKEALRIKEEWNRNAMKVHEAVYLALGRKDD